jgi:sterol 14-demethylase
MGLFQEIAGPLVTQFSQLGVASRVGVLVGGLLFLSVFFNILRQLLFKNPNEPPLVFHWFPLIGSTITYGIDPPRFFKENRAKVRDKRAPGSTGRQGPPRLSC